MSTAKKKINKKPRTKKPGNDLSKCIEDIMHRDCLVKTHSKVIHDQLKVLEETIDLSSLDLSLEVRYVAFVDEVFKVKLLVSFDISGEAFLEDTETCDVLLSECLIRPL